MSEFTLGLIRHRKTRDKIMFKRFEKKKKVKVKSKYLFTFGTKDTGCDCAPAIKYLKEAKEG